MKKIITAVALLLAGYSLSYAQCDKKVLLSAEKTIMLGADSTVQRTIDEHTEVEFDKTSITVRPGSDHTMTGTINSYTCSWTTPYKDGKLVLKTTFADGGETKNVTITIIGKEGKISFLAEIEGEGKRIQLPEAKMEERKG